MSNPSIHWREGNAQPNRRFSEFGFVPALILAIGLGWDPAPVRAQQPGRGGPQEEVLTRGPVHEAFAGVITFNAEPGIVVSKAPPGNIEELPPAERPEGDNIVWIPGYWGWDDERGDFLWISGTWRALPPGRAWTPGYWGKAPNGYQWVSGYWADATARVITYLPPPPASLEAGPNIAPPSVDYGWTPGSWTWYEGRYAWGPGYWAPGRGDWDWIPAHYIWTPRGYILVGGFWDYTVERRGLLFAPVYFAPGVYSQPGYEYSPAIVINLGVFTDHLFLRPRDHHYYFGDYYATSYREGGFYASFSFGLSRSGYDPIYSHQRWEHRGDREWEHRTEVSFQYRRDNDSARPPRLWSNRNNTPAPAMVATASAQNRPVMAAPIDQLSQRKENPIRLQSVAPADRRILAEQGNAIQESRNQRRTVESATAENSYRKPGRAPESVPVPKSTIAAQPTGPLTRGRSEPPPPQRHPTPAVGVEGRGSPPARSPNEGRSAPRPEPPAAGGPEKKSAPERSEAAPHQSQGPKNLPQPAAVFGEKGATTLTKIARPKNNKAKRKAPAHPVNLAVPDGNTRPQVDGKTSADGNHETGPTDKPAGKSGKE